MALAKIVFASMTGNTEEIADIVADKLSFHFVLPINAFLLSKCKPTLPIGASYSRFSGFHYVSFLLTKDSSRRTLQMIILR